MQIWTPEAFGSIEIEMVIYQRHSVIGATRNVH